jgi:hypothetical protein
LRRSFNPAQKARVENVGILIASGLIAGEALTALIRAALVFAKVKIPQILPESDYLYLGGIAALVIIGVYLILVPLRNAGAADEPAPPSAVI